jgi:2-oxoglutarate dehydrogenase E2 component (dihydrolipoamide succinyltransferase)
MLGRLSRVARSGAQKVSYLGTRRISQVGIKSLNRTGAQYGLIKGGFKMNQIAVRSMASSVSTEILESLGDSITTAVLLNWNKEAGDWVAEDDVIGVVETDKVTMDIRAKKTGLFVEGLCAAGDEISVGADLYKLDTGATGPVASSESSEEKVIPKPSSDNSVNKVSVEVPIMGESITTGTIAEWLVASGDFVDADQVVANIETDKVTVEVRVPQAGQIMELFAEDGAEVEVGNPLFSMDTNAIGESSAPVAKEEVAAPTPAAAAPTKASAPAPTKAAAPPTPTVSAPSSGSTDNRGETRVKMTRMRVRIAQRLKESQNTAAMLTTFQEVDMGPLITMRNKYKEEFLKIHGVKLGFMSAFVRASTTALMELPAVNGVIDDETNEIVYRNYVDVSVAVASPTGLVVPVLRNTEEMTFADVEKTIGMYGQKAKEGVLALEDMAGGTFTISNGGVFGSLFGTPIINPPQSAILGMHATKMRPMVMADGSIEARPMMYLALTYDHRLIDGREAVTFLKSVQNKIEDPSRLLLEL